METVTVTIISSSKCREVKPNPIAEYRFTKNGFHKPEAFSEEHKIIEEAYLKFESSLREWEIDYCKCICSNLHDADNCHIKCERYGELEVEIGSTHSAQIVNNKAIIQ